MSNMSTRNTSTHRGSHVEHEHAAQSAGDDAESSCRAFRSCPSALTRAVPERTAIAALQSRLSGFVVVPLNQSSFSEMLLEVAPRH